jgi:hypothetical protein
MPKAVGQPCGGVHAPRPSPHRPLDLLAAHLVTVWGTSWDIRWHLLIGRDSFWIPSHLMTYSGVTLIVLVSFGVLAWTTSQALRGVATPGMTVLTAPIDDLWHRTFGLDVTLWSPPHLLGLVGGILNAAACWLIACEAYPARSRARLVALVLAGALVYGGISLGVQPAIRIAYIYGGLLFFTYPVLASLFAPLALVATTHLSKLRVAPVLVVVTVFVIGLAGAAVSRAGFAWVQPESFLAEEIAKDPTSPIAVAHEMARKNGTTPGAFNPIFVGLALLAALGMVAVDARGRPVLASVAYSLTVFVTVSAPLARMPAFAQSLPSVPETALAAAVTVLAGWLGACSPSRRHGWRGALARTTQAIPYERDRRTKRGWCALWRRQLPCP